MFKALAKAAMTLREKLRRILDARRRRWLCGV
jgi:hypothetical protein